MKTYKIFIALLGAVLLNFSVLGQVNRSKNIRTDNRTVVNPEEPDIGRSINNDAFTTSGVEYKYDYGTETGMYLDENWVPGKIILRDGTVINDKLLRYNIHSRQMEFVDKNDTMAIANAVDVKELEFGGHKFVFASFVYDDNPVKDWLEVLVEGEQSLLLYRRIVYRYVESMSESNPETDRFFMAEKYYIKDKGGELKELPVVKREIVKCLSEKNPDIESYMKENKLKLTKESDLVKLVEYCNKKGKRD